MSQVQPIVIYIMGVSGTGKTTIGLHLAEETGLPFFVMIFIRPIIEIKWRAVNR